MQDGKGMASTAARPHVSSPININTLHDRSAYDSCSPLGATPCMSSTNTHLPAHNRQQHFVRFLRIRMQCNLFDHHFHGRQVQHTLCLLRMFIRVILHNADSLLYRSNHCRCDLFVCSEWVGVRVVPYSSTSRRHALFCCKS